MFKLAYTGTIFLDEILRSPTTPFRPKLRGASRDSRNLEGWAVIQSIHPGYPKHVTATNQNLEKPVPISVRFILPAGWCSQGINTALQSPSTGGSSPFWFQIHGQELPRHHQTLSHQFLCQSDWTNNIHIYSTSADTHGRQVAAACIVTLNVGTGPFPEGFAFPPGWPAAALARLPHANATQAHLCHGNIPNHGVLSSPLQPGQTAWPHHWAGARPSLWEENEGEVMGDDVARRHKDGRRGWVHRH